MDTYLNEGKALELRSVAGWVERIDRSTGELSSSRGKSTRIFVKEDGRWLCIHGHYTLVD